uniref:Globin domain-containing protein n=1 Tax=Glossina pallidipes TaxID=7398 RepID=A0A1A9ZTD2_GLOPL
MNSDEVSEIKKTWEIPAASPTESALDDDPSQLEEIWVKVTQSHFNRQIEKQSFNELKEVILEVLTAACSLNDQQIEIWVKLMDFIYDIIFRTIDELEQAA